MSPTFATHTAPSRKIEATSVVAIFWPLWPDTTASCTWEHAAVNMRRRSVYGFKSPVADWNSLIADSTARRLATSPCSYPPTPSARMATLPCFSLVRGSGDSQKSRKSSLIGRTGPVVEWRA